MKVRYTDVKKLLDLSLEAGIPSSENINKIIKTLSSSNGNSLAMLKSYLSALKLYIDGNTLHIYSATKLSDDQIRNIEKTYTDNRQIFGSEVIIDPGLIGGLKIQFGDNVWEDSIDSRINQIKQEIRS